MRRVGILFILFFIAGLAFAFAQENLSISTFYPSPSGVYGKLYVYGGDGDFNGDGVILSTEITKAVLCLGGSGGAECAVADVNGDGFVNQLDIGAMTDALGYGGVVDASRRKRAREIGNRLISPTYGGDLSVKGINEKTIVSFLPGPNDPATPAGPEINVGIGTSSPNAPLAVLNPTPGPQIVVRETDDGNDAIWLNSGPSGGGLDLFRNGFRTVSLTANALEIRPVGTSVKTYIAALKNTNSYINNGGNFGIGTSSPNAPLTVLNSIPGPQIVVRETDNGNDAIQLSSGSGAGALVLLHNGFPGVKLSENGIELYPGSSLKTYLSATSGLASYINNGGNFGIGTTTPGAYKLYVNGNSYIKGDLTVSGNVNKSGGTFVIDHPLDPKNKVLRHSFVESPEMKNVYDGVVTLNRKGEARVRLPKYFEALNQSFRYQLTAIGKPVSLYIKREIKNNTFIIASQEKEPVKVSWQVTGIRKDPWALKHPVIVEEKKGRDQAAKKGEYLHPEVYGE